MIFILFKETKKKIQDAHEAIRPSYFENASVDAGRDEKVLYELIWKRAVASQMSDALTEKTLINTPVTRHPCGFSLIRFKRFFLFFARLNKVESNFNDSVENRQ